MDFNHLPLAKRKRLFFIFVGVTGFLVFVVWILMFRANIVALSSSNAIAEVLGKKDVSGEEGNKDLSPSVGQVFSSYGGSMWDLVTNIPTLFKQKELEINKENN